MRQHISERVVTIGGGTGSFTMLSELKKVIAENHLWSIVTMMDSGGSSRRLMDEFGRPLPLGDLRQALVALSRRSRLWGDIFSYRFPDVVNEAVASVDGADHVQSSNGHGSGNMSGHSLGNLILHALQDQNDGDLMGAIEDAEELLNTAGHVLPVTVDQATLCAELTDGTIIQGETEIDRAENRIVLPIARLYLDRPVRATARARKAIERADRVIIGPGDLFTSVIPCLLVDGIKDALAACDGELVYVCNVMTKYGETDNYRASDFVEQIHHYLGRRVDAVVVNTGTFPEEALRRYQKAGSAPVEADLPTLRQLVPRVITGNVASSEHLIRHDAERVVMAIWSDFTG